MEAGFEDFRLVWQKDSAVQTNLFRSEEHVKNWSVHDPISEESIMPLADWAQASGRPPFRTRLEPDCLSHTQENVGALFAALAALAELGRSGSFWTLE